MMQHPLKNSIPRSPAAVLMSQRDQSTFKIVFFLFFCILSLNLLFFQTMTNVPFTCYYSDDCRADEKIFLVVSWTVRDGRDVSQIDGVHKKTKKKKKKVWIDHNRHSFFLKKEEDRHFWPRFFLSRKGTKT